MRTWRLAVMSFLWCGMLALSACGGGGSPVNAPQQGSDGDLTIELERLAAVQNTRIIPIRVIFPSTNAADDIPVWIRLGYKLSLNLSERINNMSAAPGTPDFNDPAQVFLIPPDGDSFTLFWDAARDLGDDANEDTVVLRAGVLRTNADDPREAVCDFQPVVQVILDQGGLCESLPPRIDDQTLTLLTPGQAYEDAVESDGGESPVTFTLIDPTTGIARSTNEIAPGLTMNPFTGVVSGTFSGASTSPLEFFVRMSDDCGDENNELTAQRASQQIVGLPNRFDIARITIPVATAECPEPGPEIDTDVNLTIGDEVQFQLSASGGTGALTWGQTGGTMLPGLTLTTDGQLAGRVGAYSVTPAPVVQVTDSCVPPRSDEEPLNFIIACADDDPNFNFGEIPQGMYGEAYDYTFTIDYPGLFGSFEEIDGSLPPGLDYDVTVAADGFSADVRVSGVIEEQSGDAIRRQGQGGSSSDFYTANLRARDACPDDPLSTGSNLVIEVLPAGGCPPLNITTSGLPSGTLGEPYSFQMQSVGGVPPITWSDFFEEGKGGPEPTLPPGLTISTSGLISGTPTDFGNFDVTILAGDACTPTPQVDFFSGPLVIEAPSCVELTLNTPINLFPATNGTPYSESITATGGEGQLTFAVVANPDNLPAGMTLAADGALTGTPNDEPGDYVFDITVSDTCPLGSQFDSETVTLTLLDPASCDPLLVKPIGFPAQLVNGNPLDFDIIFSGGEGNVTWAIEANPDNLPGDLTLSTGGTFSGTINDKPGTYTFDVVGLDECTPEPQEYRETVTTTVIDPCTPIAILTKGLPPATNDSPYDFTLFADGEPPFTWSLIEGALPPELVLDPDGRISGTPLAKPGTYQITVQVVDSCATGSQVTDATFDLLLNDGCAPLSITTTGLPTAQNGVAFAFQFTASGGEGQLTWMLNAESGPLPDGLILDSGGLLSGTPDDGAGVYPITVDVMDLCPEGSQIDTAAFDLTLEDIACDPIVIEKQFAPPIVIGQLYDYQLLASGGFGVLSWELDPASDPLPDGIILSMTGQLTGVVPDGTEPFEFSFIANVTDECPAGEQTEQYSQLINVVCVELGPMQGTPPDMFQNEEYFFQPTLESPGVPPYFWEEDNEFGTGLPPGIDLNTSTGTVTGFPDASSGTYTFRLLVTDACDIQQTVAGEFSLELIDCRPLGPILNQPDTVVNDEPFSYIPQLESPGSGTLDWIINGKVSLPEGLTLNQATGEISGTPAEVPGTYLIPLGVFDDCEQFASIDLVFRIEANPECPTLQITNKLIPDPFIFEEYFEELFATGGSGNYEWRLAPGSGPLPEGLFVEDFDGTWAINGFPTNEGQVGQEFTFTLQVIDRQGCNRGPIEGQRTYTVTLRQGV